MIDAATARQVVDWRRHLHANPELSFAEFRTRDFIVATLRSMGLSPREVAGTGVVATLDSGRPGPTIALRADMDALPMLEETSVPFASRAPGVMHACGHDAHMAILLGAAAVLSRDPSQFTGQVTLVFEPGEEANGGAKLMIEAGALLSPDVERIFALHVLPDLPAGTVGIRDGHLTATDDEFTISVAGRAAHSSAPHDGVNAILLASHIVTAIHSLVGTTVDPFDVAAVSVCTISGGDAINVIPANVELTGMVRCLDKDTKAAIRTRIESIAATVAAGLGGSATATFVDGYPAVINDPDCTDVVRSAVRDVVGEDALIEIASPHLGSEDFAHFQEVIPGCMAILGCGPHQPDADVGGLHSPTMAFDEDCLAVGVAVLVSIAQHHATEA